MFSNCCFCLDDEKIEILSCPFCGGEGHLSQGKKGSMPHHYIECLQCAASSDMSESPVKKYSNVSALQALVLWNKRISNG